jgi:hypothetical protein
MGAPEVAVGRTPPIALDRDKVRAAIRALPTEYVRYMLLDAIDVLPPAKVHGLARKYLDVRRLGPDRGRTKTKKADLLVDVKAFEKGSLAGEFSDSFDVNSKNFRESPGEQRTGSPSAAGSQSMRRARADEGAGIGLSGVWHHLRTPRPPRRGPR